MGVRITISDSFEVEACERYPPHKHPFGPSCLELFAEEWITQNCNGAWEWVSVFDIEFEDEDDAFLFRLRF